MKTLTLIALTLMSTPVIAAGPACKTGTVELSKPNRYGELTALATVCAEQTNVSDGTVTFSDISVDRNRLHNHAFEAQFVCKVFGLNNLLGFSTKKSTAGKIYLRKNIVKISSGAQKVLNRVSCE